VRFSPLWSNDVIRENERELTFSTVEIVPVLSVLIVIRILFFAGGIYFFKCCT